MFPGSCRVYGLIALLSGTQPRLCDSSPWPDAGRGAVRVQQQLPGAEPSSPAACRKRCWLFVFNNHADFSSMNSSCLNALHLSHPVARSSTVLTIRCTKNHFLFVVLNFLQVVPAGAPTPASEEAVHSSCLPLRACQDHTALSHHLPPIPTPSHGIVPNPEAAAGLCALNSLPFSISL